MVAWIHESAKIINILNNNELNKFSNIFPRFLLCAHLICSFPITCAYEHFLGFLVDVHIQNM